tara:strand:- start:5204 stop:5431 length:228 start_codon:yes stop_codon:yes gene_type:complete
VQRQAARDIYGNSAGPDLSVPTMEDANAVRSTPVAPVAPSIVQQNMNQPMVKKPVKNFAADNVANSGYISGGWKG